MHEPLLTIENLSILFPSRDQLIPVVDDVSLTIGAGDSLVIAGESGSGKSMLCRSFLNIVPKSATVRSSRMEWREHNLMELDEKQWRAIRGSEIAMIFQDPTAALNPLFTVERLISDAVRAHKNCSRQRARARTLEVLEMAGFANPLDQLKRYPGELSGGQRQRVAIALALSAEPALIIADEATTNLDVSIQAQIVELLCDLRDTLGLALVFVTHDLGLASEIGGDLLVIYAGQGVEFGPVDQVLGDPCHPYTRALLACAPTMQSNKNHPIRPIAGQAPKPGSVGAGAPFRDRCPVPVENLCPVQRPDWTSAGGKHRVACHRFARDARNYGT